MVQNTTNIDNTPTGSITIEEVAKDIAGQLLETVPRASYKAHQKTKSFPIDILPPKVQKLVKRAKKALGIPEDFLAVAILSAASSAVGNTYRLEIKKGVEQKGIFYMVIVGLPNSNKSGALNFAMKPLLNRDKENFEAYKAQSAAWEAEQAKPKKEQEEIEKPIFKRVIIGDATPEAVASALADSPRGMLLYRDELAGFIKDFNRYHQGGELEFWLSNWSGINVAIDRKNSEPIRIRNPFLSIIGTIQPGTIEALAKGTKAVNGFIDRFLFCWPEGLTKPEWTEENIDPHLVNEYETAIKKLLYQEFNEDYKAHLLTLTDKARKLLFQFFNNDNKRLCDEAENEMLAGIYGKFDLHASRFIIGLHLLQWAYSGKENIPLQVEAETVAKAIKVAEYFRTQALKVYKAIHHTSPVEKLPADKRKLYEALPEAFKKGDGIKIAEKLNITPKTFSRFLQERQLFEKIRHGEYGKIY
jgi:hypothetical protein